MVEYLFKKATKQILKEGYVNIVLAASTLAERKKIIHDFNTLEALLIRNSIENYSMVMLLNEITSKEVFKRIIVRMADLEKETSNGDKQEG